MGHKGVIKGSVLDIGVLSGKIKGSVLDIGVLSGKAPPAWPGSYESRRLARFITS
jgi:hypothetical protein